ncbi:MAG: hypothetical protein QOG87_3694 [Actinomycetota bacterium]
MPLAPEVSEETERWFVRQGVPHFIDDYSASRDVLTRAVPLLTLILLFEVAGAANADWPWWANVAAAAGGLALVLGMWAGVNALRRRPLLERPGRVGWVEGSVFVIAPSLLPLVFGAQGRSALATAAGNAALLGIIYVGTSYAIVPMLRWGAARTVRQLGSILGLLVRVMPLLLLFVTFLFLTVEVWEVSARLDGFYLVATAGLFVGAGTVFVAVRLPQEIGALARFDSPSTVVDLTAGTPMAERAVAVGDRACTSPALSRREWINVGLLVFFSQALQIVTVSALLGAFFMVFGLLTVPADMVARWSSHAVDELARFPLWGRDVVVTSELLRVAGFLSAFSGLYFTVTMLTDATYRQEFLDEVVGDARQAFAVRAVYLADQA